jgi:hypothetical protein
MDGVSEPKRVNMDDLPFYFIQGFVFKRQRVAHDSDFFPVVARVFGRDKKSPLCV